jgi:hypothetical protein
MEMYIRGCSCKEHDAVVRLEIFSSVLTKLRRWFPHIQFILEDVNSATQCVFLFQPCANYRKTIRKNWMYTRSLSVYTNSSSWWCIHPHPSVKQGTWEGLGGLHIYFTPFS